MLGESKPLVGKKPIKHGFREALAIVVCTFALAMSVPAQAQQDNAKTAVPGAINYVEGQASIENEGLSSASVGTVQLQPGQILTTQNGKVEVLLTPGVFLRVGSDSSVKMISPDLTNTEVALLSGRAIIEADEIHSANNIQIEAGNATTKLLKAGLYDFDLPDSDVRVLDGKAEVYEGDHHVTVKGRHEVTIANGARLKAHKFDKKKFEDSELFRWSSLRSSYLAEANINAAGMYAENGTGPWGPGWWGADWYWDPWFDAFTFIPGNGIFYSPFGWGFYSPWWVYQAPFFDVYGLGRPIYHHFGPDWHGWGPGPHYVGGPHYGHGIYHGPGSHGGFHTGPTHMGRGFGFGHAGGMRGFHGGGFHGGGFHGGVGFHGGGGFRGR